MVIAIVIALGARFAWFAQYGDDPFVRHDGSYILSTNDGYAWGDGARDLLEGNDDARSRAHFPASQLVAAVALATPFELDDVLVYLPPVLGSLIVIPMMLIGLSLGSAWLGFAAAILAATAHVYLTRTIPGAVDTDMLNITLAMAAAWGIIDDLVQRRRLSGLVGALLIALGTWWYPTIWIVFVGMVVMTAGYLWFFDRLSSDRVCLLAMLLGALTSQFHAAPAFVLPVAIYFAWPLTRRLPEIRDWRVVVVPAALVAIAISIPSAQFIWKKIEFYFLRGSDTEFAFLPVQATVLEMTVANPGDAMGMLSGAHWLGFLFALAGTGLLMWRRPVIVVGLPMLGLGLLAFFFGIRFGLFAAPWLALGLAALVLAIAEAVFRRRRPAVAIGATAVVAVLQGHWAYSDMQAPIVLSPTAEAASALGEVAEPASKAVTWWDYGYLLRYYSNLNVVVDGGLIVNEHLQYAVAHALVCGDQTTAHAVLTAIVDNTERDGFRWTDTTLVESLSAGASIGPRQTRSDVYVFVNDEMLDELGTIYEFCAVDLTTGERGEPPTLVYQRQSGQQGVELRQRYEERPQDGARIVQDRDISQVIFVETDADGNVLDTDRWRIRPRGAATFIVRTNRGDSMLVDNRLLDSFVVQAFLLGNPDPQRFEPVVSTATAKAYRLTVGSE